SPGIATTASPHSVTISANSTFADQTTLSGGHNPHGSITFKLYDNTTCAGTPVLTKGPVAVNGDGSYGSGNVNSNDAALVPGTTYQWVAVYSSRNANITYTSPTAAGCADSFPPRRSSDLSPGIATTASPHSVTISANS